MKKLISAILSIFVVAVAVAQNYPVTQNLGNTPNTLVQTNSIRAGQGIILGSFTDTAAANALPYLKNYTGAAIWCTADSSIYVRQKSSTAAFWFKIGGAGGGATGSFWNLTGNTIAAVPAGFGLGTNSADNLPLKTDNTTRVILPSTGLARQSGGAWKSMMFDTTNFTWGYGDGTNIYNSDGTLSGNRTVTTGGNEINFYTDASNYFKYTPSTQGVEALMTNGNYSTYFNVDAGNGVYMYGKDATVGGIGGFVSAYADGTELELNYNNNITGLLNNYKFGNVYSLLATENPYVGLAIDSVIGTYIGKGVSTNDHRSIRGLRVLPDWQIYMDSIDAGGTANDSVLVVQDNGKVVRRNAAAFGGSSVALSSITAATAANTIDNGDYKQRWQWNTLSLANGLSIESTSTDAAGNQQELVGIRLSGANSQLGQTTKSLVVSNAHTGSGSENYAVDITASGASSANYGVRVTATGTASNNYGLFVSASGGTNNYSLITAAGNVGIGTSTPSELLSVGASGSTKGVISLAGNTSGKVIIQPAAAAGTYTLTLPTTDGASGEFLQTDGSGVLTWAAAGGGSAAGNFGNLQINRNGAFATPGSDSLDYENATGLTVKNDVNVTGTGKVFYGRWKARVDSTTSSATPTINTDNIDIYKLTAQAADITSFTTNLSGTPYDGDIIEIVITGTAARAITWGSSFVSTTVTLPTTTSSTTTLTVILQYYKSSSYGNNKWHCVNYY